MVKPLRSSSLPSFPFPFRQPLLLLMNGAFGKAESAFELFVDRKVASPCFASARVRSARSVASTRPRPSAPALPDCRQGDNLWA